MKRGLKFYLLAVLVACAAAFLAWNQGGVEVGPKAEAAPLFIKVAPAGNLCSNQSHTSCIGKEPGTACVENGEEGTCLQGEATRDCLCYG